MSRSAEVLIPRLAQCRVERVTLTGGEPTIHPRFLDVVRAFKDAGMQVGVCTNATTLDGQQISALKQIGGVHCNVSLDGFRPESHGRFRGDRDSFDVTVARSGRWRLPGSSRGCCARRIHLPRTASIASYANSRSSRELSTCC